MSSILIVEDDVKLCVTLSEDLDEIGYFTHFVTNVDEAISYLRSTNVDLILLDLKMNGKDGFDLLSVVKKEFISVKIIVLTANIDVESAIKAAQYGVDDYILKPYQFDKLLLSTRKVLQKKAV